MRGHEGPLPGIVSSSLGSCGSPSRRIVMILVLGVLTSAIGRAQSDIFTIGGQVSFFNGRPAARVIVKLNHRSGMVREAFTNDQGRFEFPDIHGGVFTLVANNPADPTQVSDVVETQTPNRVLTDHVYVNLILREGGPGKTSKAGVITVEEAERKVPREAQKAFRQGVKFKQDKDSAKALESFTQAIKIYPDYVRALVERGDTYIAQRRLDDAAEDFYKALKINEHDGPALRGAGYCKLEKKEFAAAIELFEKSISADPSNANTHLLLGIANFELSQNDLARQALQKAMVLGVNRAHIYLGKLYAREHHYRQAADELRLYLEVEPTASDAAQVRAIEAQWRSRSTEP